MKEERQRPRSGRLQGASRDRVPVLRRLPAMRRHSGAAALIGAALLAATLFLLWSLPTDGYIYLPNEATPVAPSVEVEGHSDPGDGGGIYYVDVTVRQVRWLERILPFTRPDGATLVPTEAVTAPGETFAERRRKLDADMSRSEQVAAAIAMREAGLAVTVRTHGVLIESVAIDVPAAGTIEDGDVVVEAAGKRTPTPADLRAAIGTVEPGESVTLRFRRAGKELERTVRTVAAPDDGRRAIIGVQVSQDARIELPLDVKIDLGNVGGPSAGLPFALEVLQELGEDVDRGYRVAATGEMELDGTIAPIGGVKQKTLGVRRSGADVFLVPAGENAAIARRYAGTLRIIAVESFRQALHALRTLPRK